MADLDVELCDAMAEGGEALFRLYSRRILKSVACSLVTVLAPDAAGERLIRVHTNRPDQFPLGPGDVIVDNPWFRRVFGEAAPIVANTDAEIRAWIPDFTNAAELGYASLLNQPVVVGGAVVAVANMMGGKGHFDASRLASARAATPLVALAIAATAGGFRSFKFPKEASLASANKR